MKILVTGGAGYIGSFMVRRLTEDGHSVFVADSLERGYEERVTNPATLIKGNLNDENFLKSLFSENQFDAVMHFAGYISVEESMREPGKYFANNVFSTVKILDKMAEHKIDKFIFSSTGTVYGTPEHLPLREDHPTRPENPYAESKLMVEKILNWYFKAHGIGSAVLRYFNAAGADLEGSMGEDHKPETHIIPLAVNAALNNNEFNLYGSDYNTPDGTCIRDYIHVLDLVEAHILTLRQLESKIDFYLYNVGTGKGFSNKEVIEMIKEVSGRDFPVVIKDRRPGDVSETVADITKIQSELGFVPKFSDLKTIVESAWKWHSK